MNRIVSGVVLAAATTAVSWALKRWLSRVPPQKPPKALENWENEGGALAPQHAAAETSQR